MKTERRGTTGGRCSGPQVGEECKSKITPVTLSEDIESGLLNRTLVAMAIRACAQARCRCPGHGKGEFARYQTRRGSADIDEAIDDTTQRPASKCGSVVFQGYLLEARCGGATRPPLC